MKRTSRILEVSTNKRAARLGNRASSSGAIAMLLVALGLSTLGAGCVNNPESEPITRQEYGHMAMQMREAVESGWLSEEEMDSKLAELRMQIVPGANDDRRALRRQIGARLDAIEELVASGEMSREDADDNIARLRRRIAAGQAGQAEESRSFTRSEYARAKKKIDGMVAEGEISREAADTRLGQMRRMIVRADAAPQEEEHREFDWESTKERIEAAVEAGDITREQADARYAGIKKRIKLGEKKRGESRTFTQEEYEAAEKKIKAMVEQGKASAEDAEKRLGRMRQAMEKR